MVLRKFGFVLLAAETASAPAVWRAVDTLVARVRKAENNDLINRKNRLQTFL